MNGKVRMISYLLNNFDKIFKHGSSSLVCNDSGGEVPQDVWTHGLNSVQISET